MNNQASEFIIEKILNSDFLIKANNPNRRIIEEEKSLFILTKKNDFLSLYNQLIRYMFLILLKKGYDIKQSKVHPALKVFLSAYLSIDEKEISRIISARHAMKYYKSIPSPSTTTLTKNICTNLSLNN